MSKKLKGKVKEVWNNSPIQKPENNKHISYSQLSSFSTCQKQWYLTYVKKLAPYSPSIHTTFGTALHETIQTWLEILYHGKVKDANEMDLSKLLYDNLITEYKKQKDSHNSTHFSTQDELTMFYLDGVHILDYLKKKRATYFTTKKVHLAGIETLLYQELRPGVVFKGYIDLVFYDERVDEWLIVDIKTSTSGWNKYAKEDELKKTQILLYKEFFSRQFNIPKDKIKVEYFIVKRKVPVEAEFASMQKRVQSFKPADGVFKLKKAVQLVDMFVNTAISETGEYINKEYPTNPSKNTCRFCVFKQNNTCKDAIH